MLFNSIQFLVFFPVVTVLYYLLPYRFRWFLLLLASCIFYMAYVPAYILVIIATILVDYFAAFYIYRSTGTTRKIWLNVSILSTVTILFVFKYFNFFNDNVDTLAKLLHWNYSKVILKLALPIGLSFHTFQSLSYVIEVYRGNQKPEKNFGIYALYVMFYPQMVAGPIERPQNLLHQFYEQHDFDYDRVKRGLIQMMWGMFKKVVIADRLAVYVNAVYNHPSQYHGWQLIIATVFFAFQIYCDFSGYSDIALGAAQVMGFKLMRNFNRPYSAKTVPEFWQRWHISLSTWFRDYVYIPLGGNRVKVGRWLLNLFVVFIISGLWHGASWTFVIWGCLHFLYMVFYITSGKLQKRYLPGLGSFISSGIFSFFQTILNFILVTIAWIFFRANSVHDAFLILRSFVRLGKLSSVKLDSMRLVEVVLCFTWVLFLIVSERIMRDVRVEDFLTGKKAVFRWSVYLLLTSCVLIFGNMGNVEFIYFKF